MEIRQHYSANRAVLGVHCGVHTKMYKNLFEYSASSRFWLVRTACVSVCLSAAQRKSDLMDWRLNCRVLPCAWGIRGSKSTLPRNPKQTQQWGGYLTRLKESGGTRHWKDGGNGRFEIRTGKQIKPVTSECRRALECLPSCHQALA